MSHFTVLVVGADPELQLKPFQENNMGDCPEEFMQFNDTEDDYLKQYNEQSTEKAQLPDGRMVNTFDAEYKEFQNKELLTVREVPFKETYSSFEEFMKEWCGYSKRDEKTNRFGYWENPNKKWDWYQLGGRWTGYFKLKPNTPGTIGKPGLMTAVANTGTADQAYKKDIDFDGMRRESAREAEADYKMIQDEFDGAIPVIDIHWKDIIDPNNEAYNKLTWDARRELYRAQPALVAWNSRFNKYRETAKIDKFFEKLHSTLVWGDLANYQCSKEEYVQRAVDSSISTFALLMNGQWYAKGEMGWWACVSNEKDDWNREFSKLLDSIPGDTLLSVYDCHI